MKKLFCMLLALAMVLGLFAGCGNTAGSAAPPGVTARPLGPQPPGPLQCAGNNSHSRLFFFLFGQHGKFKRFLSA